MQSKTLQLLFSAGKPRLQLEARGAPGPPLAAKLVLRVPPCALMGCGPVSQGVGLWTPVPARTPVRLSLHSSGQSRPDDTHCSLLTGDILLLEGQDLCWGPPSSSPELAMPRTRYLTSILAGLLNQTCSPRISPTSCYLCWD